MTVPRGPGISRVASSTSSGRVVILRFLDADGDPIFIRADAILGISVGFTDRIGPDLKRVRVKGTHVHVRSGTLPVYDDYERVLELWLAATGSELLMEPADHELHFRFTEPAP